MRTLTYDLVQLCRHNRDGSRSTQAGRLRTLNLIATQLHELGFHQLRAHDLKGRHVTRLLERWQAEQLSVGTIKNRLATVRWWAHKVRRSHVLARTNGHYGLAERRYVTNESHACQLDPVALLAISDPHVRLSLELQRVFGLRRAEAIKLQPRYADHGDVLQLKASWTKGGKARQIPIRTAEQRAILQRVHQLAGSGSLIPPQRSYVQQLKVYESQTTRAGLSKLHGLRHAYAQQRYQELTGWAAPAAGGPTRPQLTAEQRQQDQAARLQISQELGHEREAISAVYLGR